MADLTYTHGPEIGVGASGIVYAATLSDGRQVAVKQVPLGYHARLLRHEASVLAGLKHPNIVRFYGLQISPDDQEQLELVTEFVEGVTLAQLRRGGRLPVAVCIHIVREVLSALEHVHATANLVHRDLSPRNILIGVDGQVKVADFGLAKIAGAARTTTSFRGTPGYVSPEQLRGDRLDIRSDLFAVGINLYEMLTETSPFCGDGVEDLQQKRPITPITAVRPGLSDKLEAITAKLLEYDRNRRYGSPGDVLQALPEAACGHLDLADLIAKRAQAKARQRTPWPRRLAAMALLGAGILLGAGGLSLYAAGESDDPMPPRPPSIEHVMTCTAEEPGIALDDQTTDPAPLSPAMPDEHHEAGVGTAATERGRRKPGVATPNRRHRTKSKQHAPPDSAVASDTTADHQADPRNTEDTYFLPKGTPEAHYVAPKGVNIVGADAE